MSEDSIKEGWFTMKSLKGLTSLNIFSSKYYFVLNSLYIEWFDSPKGQWIGGIPINQCEARLHDGVSLVIGKYKGKDYILNYEGTNPVSETHEWYDEIMKAKENYPKAKMISNNKPLTKIEEKQPEIVQQTIQTNQPLQPTQTTYYTTTIPTQTTYYSQPVQTTYYSQPVYQPVQTTYTTAPVYTNHVVHTQPTYTTVQPSVTYTTTTTYPPPYY